MEKNKSKYSSKIYHILLDDNKPNDYYKCLV